MPPDITTKPDSVNSLWFRKKMKRLPSLQPPGSSFLVFCLFLFMISFPVLLLSGQEIPVRLDYPSFPGDFYASGNVSFPPGGLPSEYNVIVKTAESAREIPSGVKILKLWPDGSIQSAEITFPANSKIKEEYVLAYGNEIKRKKSFTEAAVLPAVSFFIGGAPKRTEKVDMDVGQINVRVDKSPNLYYYWHLLPIILLIYFTCYRSRKTKKTL